MNNCCNKPFNWQPWKGLPADLGEDSSSNPPPVDPPIADFTMADSNALAIEDGGNIQQGLDLLLTNTSTNATSYQWLVDGTPVATTTDHSFTVDSVTYACGATITIQLIATGANNQTDSRTQTVTVICA